MPSLWLFTDAARLADPRAAVLALPRGLAGVVYRPEGVADRAGLGRALARICRDRRLALVVAGDWRLAVALRSGVHLRGGRKPPGQPGHLAQTSSAHHVVELHRAHAAGVRLAFLSPAFPTASHPGAPALGAVRWSALARTAPIMTAALGGITAVSVRRLAPDRCRGAGAIAALVA